MSNTFEVGKEVPSWALPTLLLYRSSNIRAIAEQAGTHVAVIALVGRAKRPLLSYCNERGETWNETIIHGEIVFQDPNEPLE